MVGLPTELRRLDLRHQSLPHLKTSDAQISKNPTLAFTRRLELRLHGAMAKSARASSVKKNNQRLKKHVFGPIEAARNERLSAKLLELATQPKPSRTEMEVEQSSM